MAKLSDQWGLFAIDPGTTTGVAHTIKPIQAAIRPKEAFAGAGINVYEVSRVEEDLAARQIAREWLALNIEWDEYNIPSSQRLFVYEDFVLRGGYHSSERSGLSPVRMTALIQGYLLGRGTKPRYVMQSPATAKARWTNDRLKRADLWTVGKVHGRDATRHLALAYVNL